MNKPAIVIGLTGNIGTGKSTVLELLRQRGARIIDTDKVAHEVMSPGGAAYERVIKAFGREVLQEDGSIDRKRLGEIVFADPDKLSLLEQIVHPAVFTRLAKLIAEAEEPVVFIEAIKLFEAGMSITLCDQVWVVTAPTEQQIERLMRTRNMSRAEAEARMALQSPQAFKAGQADLVIDNSGTLEELKAQVDAAWQHLQEELVARQTASETTSPAST
ncbi:MAG: dephospho-CoA kinase [Chloroflexi bacterium]|nr:dephospho-CoA kinase [Chloroflexota bacterium]